MGSSYRHLEAIISTGGMQLSAPLRIHPLSEFYLKSMSTGHLCYIAAKVLLCITFDYQSALRVMTLLMGWGRGGALKKLGIHEKVVLKYRRVVKIFHV